MITLRAQSHGREPGQYIARVTGRDPRWTFDREFVGRKVGRRHETTEADLDTPGLYEVCDIDRRNAKAQRYVLVLDYGRRLAEIECPKKDAMRIARSLGEGLAVSQILVAAEGGGYEILTPAQRRAADVARSVERVTDECWASLQSLPLRHVKRVLTELRRRLSPAPEPAEQPADTAPEATP